MTKHKIFKFIWFVLFFVPVVCLNAQTLYFYYNDGERQYFELDTRYIFISVTEEEIAKKTFATQNAKYEPLRADIPEGLLSQTNQKRRFYTTLSFEESISEEDYLRKMDEIKNSDERIIVAPHFKNKYVDQIGISNFFYVKLKELRDTVLLKREAEKENAVIMWQNKFMPLWFTLSVTENTKYNSMELSNKLYESDLFQYAYPDLLNAIRYDNCANDQHFGQQWGLLNTGQSGGINGIDIKVCSAWEVATGNGIFVAVVDDGVHFEHPDLEPNVPRHLSYDADNDFSPHSYSDKGEHGTPCVGIIAAVRNNQRGVAGVAPDSKVMSIKSGVGLGQVLGAESRARGIRWAMENGADVISNSWSFPSPATAVDQQIRSAINYVTQNGRIRNGVRLGCVVVNSTGNDSHWAINFPGTLDNVIAVGAIDRNGIRLSNSNYGAGLNVVAPGSEVHTTNYLGGYSNVGWTSAACPHVSGVAALILSVNPDLYWYQVRSIIESTAQKLLNHLPNNTTYPGWNNQVGYGLVNAYASAKQALCMLPNTIFSKTVTTNENVYGNNVTVQNTTVNSGRSLKIVACNNITIGSNVTVKAGATLELKAYGSVSIDYGTFIVESGAIFIVK